MEIFTKVETALPSIYIYSIFELTSIQFNGIDWSRGPDLWYFYKKNLFYIKKQ
jgi:hypothetical protein